MDLKLLFGPGKIGTVQIKNKIVRSATWVARATKDGYVTEELIDFYKELAEGGTGLIISGYIAMDPLGAATRNMTRLYEDSFIHGQKKLVKAVHNCSDVKFGAQIAHTGNQAYKSFDTVGPSSIKDPLTKKTCRELRITEVEDIIKNFIKTGCRAYECGYDMIQIHAAHGYLLSDFLSPFTNRRTDTYGGSISHRAKILVDIYSGLREALGKSIPIIIKLNIKEYLREGLTLEEGQEIAKICIDAGYDAIEPSTGRVNFRFSDNKTYPSVMFNSTEEENYFIPLAKKIKPIMKERPIILMGGIRNPFSAEKILQEGISDFISMSRPLIYEPSLPNRWKNGDLAPSLCINCNACLGTGLRGNVHCTIKEKLAKNSMKDGDKRKDN